MTTATQRRPGKVTTGTEKVEKVGVKREKGFLYFISKPGHVMRARLTRSGANGGKKPELVQKVGIIRVAGYLYFIDKDGDISRVRMANAMFRAQPTSRG